MTFFERWVDYIRQKDGWDRAAVLAQIGAALATTAAAVFAAWSAFSSHEQIAAGAARLDPVFVLEQSDTSWIVQYSNDIGFRTKRFGPADRDENALPALHLKNYGGPALNVRVKFRWAEGDKFLSLPKPYASEMATTGPRFIVRDGHLITGHVSSPIASQGVVDLGGVGPELPAALALPSPAANYLWLMTLSDAQIEGRKLQAPDALTAPRSVWPIVQHDLIVVIQSDAITGRHVTQEFTVRLIAGFAVDRSTNPGFDGVQPRIEEADTLVTLKTTLPKP